MIPKRKQLKDKIKSLEDSTKIEKVTNFIVAATGYEVLTQDVFKQGKRYWGSAVIQKSSGTISSSASTVFAKFASQVQNIINSGCFLGTEQWSTSAVGYFYTSGVNIIIADSANSNKYTVAKINFDVVIY